MIRLTPVLCRRFDNTWLASAIWRLRPAILISTQWCVFLASALGQCRRIWMRCVRKTSPVLCCSRHDRPPRPGPGRSQPSAQGCAFAAPFAGHPVASKWRIAGRDRRAIATSQPQYHADLCQVRQIALASAASHDPAGTSALCTKA